MNNIALPALGQGFGQKLSETFGDINSNFQDLVNLFNMYRLNPNSIDFLTINLDFDGDTDDTLFLEFCKYTQLAFKDASGAYSRIIQFLKDKIASAVAGASTSSITGTIALAVSPNPQFNASSSADTDGENFPITIAYTLPYIVSLTVRGSVESHIVLGSGYTSDQNICVLNLRQSSDFPYIKLVGGQYVWVLNGQVTNIPAQGAPGASGNSVITVNAHHRLQANRNDPYFAWDSESIIEITDYPAHTAVLLSVEKEPAVFYISEIDDEGHIPCNEQQQIRPYWAYVHDGVSEPDLRWSNQYIENTNPGGCWESDTNNKCTIVHKNNPLDIWLNETSTGVELFKGNNGFVWKKNIENSDETPEAWAWITDDVVTHGLLYLELEPTDGTETWVVHNKTELTPGYYRVNIENDECTIQDLKDLLIYRVSFITGADYLGIDPSRLYPTELSWRAYYYSGYELKNIANTPSMTGGHRKINLPTVYRPESSWNVVKTGYDYVPVNNSDYNAPENCYNPGDIFGANRDTKFYLDDINTWTNIHKVKYVLQYIISRYISSTDGGVPIRKFRYVNSVWDASYLRVSITTNDSTLKFGGVSKNQVGDKSTWELPVSFDLTINDARIYGSVVITIGNEIEKVIEDEATVYAAYQEEVTTNIWTANVLFTVDISSLNLVFEKIEESVPRQYLLKGNVNNDNIVDSIKSECPSLEIWWELVNNMSAEEKNTLVATGEAVKFSKGNITSYYGNPENYPTQKSAQPTSYYSSSFAIKLNNSTEDYHILKELIGYESNQIGWDATDWTLTWLHNGELENISNPAGWELTGFTNDGPMNIYGDVRLQIIERPEIMLIQGIELSVPQSE